MRRLLFFTLPALLATLILSGCGSTAQVAKDLKVQDNLTEALRLAQLDKTTDARRWADRAVAVDLKDVTIYLPDPDAPDPTVTRISVADVFNAVGDDPALAAYMKVAAQKFPRSYWPLVQLSGAQERLGDVAGQRATATQLAALLEKKIATPGAHPDAALMNMLAQAYCDAGNTPQGVADYQKVMRVYPNDPEAYNALAYQYAVANDTANMGQALALAQRAVAIANRPGTIKFGNGQSAPDNIVELDKAGFQDTLGWVQYRLGKYPEAQGNIADAANSMPRMAEVRYHLGMVYLAQNEKAAALAEFAHAALLSKGYQAAQMELNKLQTAPATPQGTKV